MRLLLYPPILMLLIFVPAAIGYRFLDPAGRPPFLIYGIRWFLGILFLISGLAKLVPGFPNTMGPPDLELQLAPHSLALFGRFIALSEVATGLLLLTRRFATLGALLLMPMLASIIVVTTSLHWQGTPYLVGGFLLLDLVLLLYDYPKLKVLVGDRTTEPGHSLGSTALPHLPWVAGLGVVLVVLGWLRFSSSSSPGLLLLLLCLLGLIVADWIRRVA